jgi:hypothetical protein
MTDTSDLRQEMAATRDRMSRDIDELQSRASERVESAKQRVNVAHLVREHPWPALGAAVVLGAIVGGSGADRKAAAATLSGAKRAAQASKDAASDVVEKVRSRGDESSGVEIDNAPESKKRGFGDRMFDALGASVASNLDRVLDEMRAASREWGARWTSQKSRSPSAPTSTERLSVVAAPAAVAGREESVATELTDSAAEADAIPVPNEMLPSEVDARADAVEALGGGTHEPPLAPGAGDLGARWA